MKMASHRDMPVLGQKLHTSMCLRMEGIARWDCNSHLRGPLSRPGLHHKVTDKGTAISHITILKEATQLIPRRKPATCFQAYYTLRLAQTHAHTHTHTPAHA